MEFIRPLTDVEIQERSLELILECELNKSVHVEWYRFSTELTSITDEQRIFIEHNDLIHRLIIKNIQMDDNGTYTCRYSPQHVDSLCKVRVNELPLAIIQNLNDEYIITENDDLILNIELNKITFLKFEWLKNGILIENNEHIKIINQGEKYQLKIHDIKLNDQGKYTFRILEANIEGNTNVQINELPIYFTRNLKDISIIMENTRDYQLDCEINKENKIAQWFKDNEQQILITNDEYQIKSNGRIHAIIFNTIQLKHAGKYTCQFSEDIKSIGSLQVEGKNFNGKFILQNYFFCLDAPTEFEVGLQNVTIIEDEPLSLECILTKDRPDDQVIWLFNNEPLLIDNERIKISKIGPIVKLIIDECQLTDDGRYQAEINGKTSKATVVVKGKILIICKKN